MGLITIPKYQLGLSLAGFNRWALKSAVLALCHFLFLSAAPLAWAQGASPSKPTINKVDVLIIGAGLAGLSTAYHLKKAGLSYHIIEASPHVGGRLRTAQYSKGLRAEVGLEEFWQNNPTLQIIKDLNIPVENSAASFSSFMFQGKLYPFIHANNRESLLLFASPEEVDRFYKWDSKVRSLYEKTQLKPLSQDIKDLMEISFKDWVQSEDLLSPLLKEFIRIESEPEYAISWDQISAIEGILEWHLFSGEGSQSYHILGGNQKLAEKMEEFLGESAISLNTKVTRVLNKDDGVIIDAVNQGTFHTHSYEGKYVVSTIPLFRLLEMQFEPPLAQEFFQAIRSQSWGSYFTAHVFIDSEAQRFWGGNFDLFPVLTDSSLGVIYLGEFPNNEKYNIPTESFNMAKSSDGKPPLLLNLLIHGPPAERFNYRAATAMDEVREEILQSFEKMWPGSRGHISKVEFYQYHPRAIAAWPVGRSRLDEQSELFRQPRGRLYFAGDFTESSHSDGAALSALRASEAIIKKELEIKHSLSLVLGTAVK